MATLVPQNPWILLSEVLAYIPAGTVRTWVSEEALTLGSLGGTAVVDASDVFRRVRLLNRTKALELLDTLVAKNSVGAEAAAVPTFLTQTQAAAQYRISPRRLRTALLAGHLRSKRVGEGRRATYIIDQADLEKWRRLKFRSATTELYAMATRRFGPKPGATTE